MRVQTKVFKSKRSQVVHLSKSVALPASVQVVDIAIIGRSRLISPAGESWDSWFDGESVSDDFMVDREQPVVQEREMVK